nr:Uncharacterised protein [Klebsiella pneumoniae]
MAVSKLPNGKWQAQVFPNGRDGKRIRRQFATKGEALAFERHIKIRLKISRGWARKLINAAFGIWLQLGITHMALRLLMVKSVKSQWSLPVSQWAIPRYRIQR